MNWNFHGSSVSRLKFSPVKPASTILGSLRFSAMPLLVIHTSFSPMLRSFPSSSTSSTMSLRTVGSPPVNLILVTPCETNRRAISRISGVERRWAAGERGTPSSGMQ